ncbi:MAG: response regulator transcription factor [Oscillibacter sp.]|nr:response regulator transcription factor [Oscillibacter sp.]
MEQLNIAVCEDVQADLRHLCGLITANGVSANVSLFENGEDFLAACQPDKFDLIFMDIYLDGLNGVEAVRRVRETDRSVPVAFTTTSEDFALDSYRLNAAKYIEKPASQGEVDEIIALALHKKAERDRGFIIWGRRDPIRFSPTRLRYVEQREHSLAFYLAGGGILRRKGKLNDLELLLAKYPFFRCHKSYLVNLDFVLDINREQMVFQMKEGGNAYIRRETFYRAKGAWENWLFTSAREKGGANE